MNTKQANDMLKWAEFLRTEVKPRYFDMSTVCEGEVNDKHPCGTAACAMGYLPMVFPKRFKLDIRDWYWGWNPHHEATERVPLDHYEANGVKIRSNGESANSNSLSKEFGGTPEEMSMLFYPNDNYTPKQQAKRMIDYIKSQGFEIVEVEE